MKKEHLPIKGFIPITLLDWPGKIASMIFVGGCNFRCGYCYNKELVLHPEKLPEVDKQEIFSYLEKKKNWVDGVIISGGEPTLYESLTDLLKEIKNTGLFIQVQTNGTNPEMLQKLIKQKLVDCIAMDIKGPLNKYEKITGTKINTKNIEKSIRLIAQNPKIEFEFRTTVAPNLLSEKDFESIGKWLKKIFGPRSSKIHYYIQQFRNEKTLDGKQSKIKPLNYQGLEKIVAILKKYIRYVEIRGI
ncbi:MAG: anaerobic ribonucleoside-triphosphate reductase activating protein [Candidatus Berkelbacteria bacterium]|nr:anaerobic ribonucleoside-triphosphate reductase activating protein [Candidatus Berkelbacteria bacterium]